MTKIKRVKSFAVYWISFKCRETFIVLFHLFESAAIAQIIHRESFEFVGSSKIHENREGFFSHSFGRLWYLSILVTQLFMHLIG